MIDARRCGCGNSPVSACEKGFAEASSESGARCGPSRRAVHREGDPKAGTRQTVVATPAALRGQHRPNGPSTECAAEHLGLLA